MKVRLTELIETEGSRLCTSGMFERTVISLPQGDYPVRECSEISLSIVNVGKKVLELRAACRVGVTAQCDRCLRDTEVVLDLDIFRKLDLKLSADQLAEELDDCAWLDGVELDIDELVYLEILMNWPLKILCRQDCPGLCSRCGKYLGDGPCDCADEPKDPRMAAISDLFRKYKEV